MGRLGAFLLVLVVASALSVITSQHHARKLFNDLESEQGVAKKLDDEFTQLQLEQSTWATNKRVESVAAKQLGMRLPDPSNTVIVTVR
jgi:cell division protein FtsL